MAILNSSHLFLQADSLITPPPAGPPRQVDLRRAISSAYYGLFHYLLTALADEFVGVTQRTTSRYALVYRSVDHAGLRQLCLEATKPTPAARYRPYLPAKGFGDDVQSFAAAILDLQEKRHRSDYDPLPRFKTVDAERAVAAARSAAERFKQASATQQRMFLTLLLCPPR